MLRRHALRIAAAAIVLALACAWATPAAAQAQGASCSVNGQTAPGTVASSANNLICISGTWQYPVYVLQSAAAAAQSSCTGHPAGAERWNTTLTNLEVCDGTTWQAVGNTSTTCGSPSGLSFTNVTGATLSTLYTSGTATIIFSGCSSSLSVSVTGGGSPQISVNGGGWTTSASIFSGQTLQVRLTSSGSGSTVLTATVTVASTSTNWTVTTAALDPCTGTATPPSVGGVCTDGSVYAGVTPDGNVAMYVTPCDYGMTGSAGSCTGSRGTLEWSAGTSVSTGVTSQTTGKANTLALHNDDGNADAPYSAADYCYTLSYLGHSDWYLPAIGELNVMYINDTAITGFDTSGNQYWSSTDNINGVAYSESFDNGTEYSYYVTGSNYKYVGLRIRCARHN
jgi:hypothetical protein